MRNKKINNMKYDRLNNNNEKHEKQKINNKKHKKQKTIMRNMRN